MVILLALILAAAASRCDLVHHYRVDSHVSVPVYGQHHYIIEAHEMAGSSTTHFRISVPEANFERSCVITFPSNQAVSVENEPCFAEAANFGVSVTVERQPGHKIHVRAKKLFLSKSTDITHTHDTQENCVHNEEVISTIPFNSVTQVDAWSGGTLDAFRWYTAQGPRDKVGGDGGTSQTFVVPSGRCINRVGIRQGDSTDGVEFWTNDGVHSGFMGNKDAGEYQMHHEHGKCVVGFEVEDHRPFLKFLFTIRCLKTLKPIWAPMSTVIRRAEL
jgi:hypothetical protein